MVAAEAPTKIDVMLMKLMGAGPVVRDAHTSSVKRKRIATMPKRPITKRRGSRTKTSAPMAMMTRETTTFVQCVGTVNDPRCQGALVRSIGVKVIEDVPLRSVP